VVASENRDTDPVRTRTSWKGKVGNPIAFYFFFSELFKL